MSSPASPAETRAYILERLTGAAGEPDHVVAAGEALARKTAGAVATKLADFVSAVLPVEAGEVRVARLSEALPAADGGAAVTFLPLAGIPEPMILALDAAAIAILVDVFFGAGGSAPSASGRPPSSIELELAGRVMELAAEGIVEANLCAPAPKPPFPAAVCGPDSGKQSLRDGPAVRLSIRVGEGDAGMLTITLPQRILMKRRTDGAPATDDRDPMEEQWSARLGNEVKRSTIALDAIVPLGRMSLGEIAALRPGQVIELPESAQVETRLGVRERTLFVCEFGRVGQQYTVRIRQPFDPSRDLVEGLISG